MRAAFRPGWPHTITASPGANVFAAQPYCFMAVEGNASTTQTRSLPLSRSDRYTCGLPHSYSVTVPSTIRVACMS